MHYSDSTWIVKTDLPCVQIRNMLEPFVNSGDKLLIVEISGVGAWHGLNGCKNVLQNHLSDCSKAYRSVIMLQRIGINTSLGVICTR